MDCDLCSLFFVLLIRYFARRGKQGLGNNRKWNLQITQKLSKGIHYCNRSGGVACYVLPLSLVSPFLYTVVIHDAPNVKMQITIL